MKIRKVFWILVVQLICYHSIAFGQLECRAVDLASVPQILNAGVDSNPCYNWVSSVSGRIMRVNVASGAVWSRNTVNGTGLLLTARHVLGDAPQMSGANIKGYFGPPSLDGFSQPELFVYQPKKDGSDVYSFRNQTFRLFTQPLVKEEYQNQYSGILPKSDFVVGVMTQRHLAPEQIGDGSIDLNPLEIFDPLMSTQNNPTYSDPIQGENVIILGYPRDTDQLSFNGIMAYSIGKVFSTAEAKNLIAKDVDEAKIDFDEKVEFAVEARSLAGMSGGGAFDQKGRFLGTLVRGNDIAVDGHFFTRVVRIKYVIDLLNFKLGAMPASQSKTIKTWLEK